ncbi:MAG TPA: hypothetical protein VIX86_16455 [Streptosporangiaceae bacterium]
MELTAAARELPTAASLDLLGQARALGVLQAHLSGGEPLLRREGPRAQARRGHRRGGARVAGPAHLPEAGRPAARAPSQLRKEAITMTAAEITTVLENDRVVVRRVRRSGSGPVWSGPRGERLVIYLQPAHVRRTEHGQQEDLHRSAGDVIWRPASTHDIEHTEGGEHDVLIVEFKD